MTFFLLDTLSFPAVLELLTSMRAELVLSCFYSPIGVSPENLIIFRNYTYSGIASTRKLKNLEKIQKFFGLVCILGEKSYLRLWMGDITFVILQARPDTF
jgi:hypothetical protein